MPNADLIAPASGYRFGYNGQEKDVEVKGNNNSYSFDYRMYDARLGKFLSVDPLAPLFSGFTPYAFAQNRVIDGIDMEGLEYLNASDARVEFKYGKLQLKVENFHYVTQNKWNQQAAKPGNIGIDPAIEEFSPETFSTDRDAEMKDNPKLPSSMDPDARISQGMAPGFNALMGTPIGKGLIAIQAFEEGATLLAAYLITDDLHKIGDHSKLALKAINDINKALKDPKFNGDNPLVPSQYRNQESLMNIANVVLTGQNNTSDPNIYKIGMDIYNNISNPIEQFTILTSHLDNYPNKLIRTPLSAGTCNGGGLSSGSSGGSKKNSKKNPPQTGNNGQCPRF